MYHPDKVPADILPMFPGYYLLEEIGFVYWMRRNTHLFTTWIIGKLIICSDMQNLHSSVDGRQNYLKHKNETIILYAIITYSNIINVLRIKLLKIYQYLVTNNNVVPIGTQFVVGENIKPRSLVSCRIQMHTHSIFLLKSW